MRTRQTLLQCIDDMQRQLDVIRAALDDCLDEELLGCREAAIAAGVTPQTISAWIREGRLKKRSRQGRTGLLRSEVLQLKRNRA